jgi:hypothetical protein
MHEKEPQLPAALPSLVGVREKLFVKAERPTGIIRFRRNEARHDGYEKHEKSEQYRSGLMERRMRLHTSLPL